MTNATIITSYNSLCC